MKADNTLSLISRIHQGMNEVIMEEVKKSGIEGIVPSHGSIMVALFNGKVLTMNDLAERIGKTPQTVTTLVKKLLEMGYVQCEKAPKDRRTTLVSLTAKGESLKDIFAQASAKLYERQYQGMSEEEIREFRRLLLLVWENFN